MFPNVLKTLSIFNISRERVKRVNINSCSLLLGYCPTYSSKPLSDSDYIDLKSSDRKEDARGESNQLVTNENFCARLLFTHRIKKKRADLC